MNLQSKPYMKKKRLFLYTYRAYKTLKNVCFEPSIHTSFRTYEAIANTNVEFLVVQNNRGYQAKSILPIKVINLRLQFLSENQKTIWALHSAGFSNEQIEDLYSAPQNWAKNEISNLYSILLHSKNSLVTD